jgi:hypothetical protein
MGRGCRVITRNVADVDDDLATFAKSIIDAVVRKSCHLLVERLAGRTFASDDPLVAAVVSGNGRCGDLRVGLSPDIPIVAVGGPAAIYYREVGDRLSTTTLIPPHSAVANAIGAATGVIRVQQSIEISAHEDGGFTLHLPNVPRHIKSADEALRQASRVASEQAEQRAREMGAVTVELTLDVQRVDIPDTIDDQGLIAATVTAECIGTLI